MKPDYKFAQGLLDVIKDYIKKNPDYAAKDVKDAKKSTTQLTLAGRIRVITDIVLQYVGYPEQTRKHLSTKEPYEAVTIDEKLVKNTPIDNLDLRENITSLLLPELDKLPHFPHAHHPLHTAFTTFISKKENAIEALSHSNTEQLNAFAKEYEQLKQELSNADKKLSAKDQTMDELRKKLDNSHFISKKLQDDLKIYEQKAKGLENALASQANNTNSNAASADQQQTAPAFKA